MLKNRLMKPPLDSNEDGANDPGTKRASKDAVDHVINIPSRHHLGVLRGFSVSEG